MKRILILLAAACLAITGITMFIKKKENSSKKEWNW